MTTTTTTQRYTVSITSIVCESTADTGNANDEVFVIWQADGGIPVRYPATNYQKMNTTPSTDVVSTWTISAGDLDLVFEKEVLVTLWDSTITLDPSSAIYLMSYEYTAPGINPGYPSSEASYTMSNHNAAEYTINASPVTEVTGGTDSALQAEVRPHFGAIKRHLGQVAPRSARSGATTDEGEAQVARVLAATVQAWKSSAEGAASLQKMRGLGLKDIHAELDSIVKGPYFSGALQLAAGQGLVDLSLFQSFTLGFAVSAEIFLGVYGSIGYVCDISLLTGQGGETGIYLTGAIAEEVGAGLDGLVEAGVWRESMSSLPGSYTALAVDIGDIEGEEIGYFQFKSDDTTEGYVVGIGIGEDYEVGDLDPAYIFVFGMTSDYPVMQADANNCLILTKLQCLNKAAQADGHDEVTLYITADAPSGSSTTYRYPTWDDFAMGDDSGDWNIWYPGRSVMFNNSVTVKATDGDTELGSFTLNLSNFSGVGSTYTPPASDLPISVFQNVSYQITALLITKGS